MERKLFLGANTADGLVHFFTELIEMYDLKKLYVLKGGSGIGKSTFIKKFASAFEHPKTCINYFYCSGDPRSLDGAVIEFPNGVNIGIIDGTHPHPIDPRYPGIIDEIINLGEFITSKDLSVTKAQIDKISAAKQNHYKQAFGHLAKAREFHYKLESSYKNAVDFDKIDALLNKLIEKTVQQINNNF